MRNVTISLLHTVCQHMPIGDNSTYVCDIIELFNMIVLRHACQVKRYSWEFEDDEELEEEDRYWELDHNQSIEHEKEI